MEIKNNFEYESFYIKPEEKEYFWDIRCWDFVCKQISLPFWEAERKKDAKFFEIFLLISEIMMKVFSCCSQD